MDSGSFYNKYLEEIETLKKENETLKDDLNFYKSVHISHPNSAICNLYIKKKNKKKIWIDKIVQYWSLNELNEDPEVKEWLKPIRCER